MTESGILEGKKGIAAYLTPRIIRAIINILYTICMVALIIFAGSIFMDSMQELKALVESGDIPRCVMTLPLSGLLIMFAWTMLIKKR